MYRIEDILAAANAIRENLPKLLGEQAQIADRELSDLLAKAKAGEDVEIEILDLLSEYESTRTWMQQALKDKRSVYRSERGFSPLPGDSFEIPSGLKRYKCPETNCTYTWTQRKAREKIPKCRLHNKDLKLIS